MIQRFQFLVERAGRNDSATGNLPFFDLLDADGADRSPFEKRRDLVQADDAPDVCGFFHLAPNGFEPHFDQFIEMDVLLLASVQTGAFLAQLGQTPPGERFIDRFERALNLLARHGKPREISSVIVYVKILAHALESVGLVSSHADSLRLPKWLTSARIGEQESFVNYSQVDNRRDG